MSKFLYSPVVGIDVASDHSIVTILDTQGAIFRKAFRVEHDSKGFKYLLAEIKKAEVIFLMDIHVFMESTGIYHLNLFYFLKTNNINAYIINPLITNCNKNKNIRKVKNDKLDSLAIAKMGKYDDIKTSDFFEVNLYDLKVLCREYYHLTDMHAKQKKKLTNELHVIFPGYDKVFDEIDSKTSIAILQKYKTPHAILKASKDEMLQIISIGKQTLAWREKVYKKLIVASNNAIDIGIPSNIFSVKIEIILSILDSISVQLEKIVFEIKGFLHSENMPEEFKKNFELIKTIPGSGFISALTVLVEMSNFNFFSSPKKLVAFFGIDPSVEESGKYKSDNNKISKRGSSFARRALYFIALSSIRKKTNGVLMNPVLKEFYTNKIAHGKKKKVAIIAVMHKLVNYIFSILRDQKGFELRYPNAHKELHCVK
jgi:transposase